MKSATAFILLLLVFFLTACASDSAQETTIGAILPLTGDYATLGSEIQRGIELANEESQNPVKILYEDVGSITPAKAVAPANKLLRVDGITVGLVADAQNAVVLGPVFSEHETPLVVLWDSNKDILGSGKSVYSTGFSSERSAQHMANYSYYALGLRSVAVVQQQDPYAIVVARAFEKQFTELGGSVVLSEEAGIDEQDFRTILLKIKDSGAEAIYFPIVPQSEVNFAKQARSLVPEVTLLASDWFFQDTIDAAGDAAEGIYLHTIYADDPDGLAARYKNKYGVESPDITVVDIGYTGMRVVLNALEREEPLAEALTAVIGPNRTLNRAEKVYRIESGKIVLAE